MDSIKLNSDELRNAAKDLVKHNDIIKNTYTSKILPALRNNEKLVDKSKVNNEELVNVFNDTFNEINNTLNDSAYFINNRVLGSYGELEGFIVKSFNSEFASTFAKLTGINK